MSNQPIFVNPIDYAELLNALSPHNNQQIFNINRGQSPTLGSCVNPWCPRTNEPVETCMCDACAPQSEPAPEAPEVCKLSYYGIRCTNALCRDAVHRTKGNPTY